MEAKSFYHRKSDDILQRGVYMTPLERKAVRTAKNITLDEQMFVSCNPRPPLKEQPVNGNSNKPHVSSKRRKLKGHTAKKVEKALPLQPRVPKVNWAPKSLSSKFSRQTGRSKARKLAVAEQRKRFKDIVIKSRAIDLKAHGDQLETKIGKPLLTADKLEAISSDPPPGEQGEKAAEQDIFNCGSKDTTSPKQKNIDENVVCKSHMEQNGNKAKRFYSIFERVCKQKSSSNSGKLGSISPKNATQIKAETTMSDSLPKSKARTKESGRQLIIDAGQKRFGATQCSLCGMVYSANHPEDEQDHSAYHGRFLSYIKFKGWKNEKVVASFMDGRIIKVSSADPKYAMKKVSDMLTVVDTDLGFKSPNVGLSSSATAYLFVSEEEKIIGCLLAEKIYQSHRLIAASSDGVTAGESTLCFTENTPRSAVCGVSRIWTYAPMRRSGIATRLLDTVRESFVLGTVLDKDQVAFSHPTPDGRAFASKYFGTPNILVYNVQ